jgi:hypothetical protein
VEVTRLARDYVEAFNRRDGERVCDLWTPRMHGWLERGFLAGGRGHGCAKTIEVYIGYAEDSPDRKWQRARIVKVGRVAVAGERASVALTIRHTRGTPPRDDLRPDVLHFVRHDGDWKLGKQGRIFFEAIGALNVPESVLDPPAEPKLLGRPAKLPAPSFECRGRAEAITDAPADVAWYDEAADTRRTSDAPWLDVRRATARRRGGAACIVIELGAPPRPGSSYQWAFDEPVPGPGQREMFRPYRVGLRIDGTGRPHLLGRADRMGATAFGTTAPRVGVRGNELHLALTTPVSGWLRWSVLALSVQGDEPILPDPLRGEDQAPDQ